MVTWSSTWSRRSPSMTQPRRRAPRGLAVGGEQRAGAVIRAESAQIVALRLEAPLRDALRIEVRGRRVVAGSRRRSGSWRSRAASRRSTPPRSHRASCTGRHMRAAGNRGQPHRTSSGCTRAWTGRLRRADRSGRPRCCRSRPPPAGRTDEVEARGLEIWLEIEPLAMEALDATDTHRSDDVRARCRRRSSSRAC